VISGIIECKAVFFPIIPAIKGMMAIYYPQNHIILKVVGTGRLERLLLEPAYDQGKRGEAGN
jgi:hypothetical protein